MTEYFCDFCGWLINEDIIEVGYDGKKLLYFHPMACVKDLNSRKCPADYFNSHTELEQLVTAFYAIPDLEIIDKGLILKDLIAKFQEETSN